MTVQAKLQRFLLVLVVSLTASSQLAADTSISVTLPADGSDMEWDASTRMLYVSLPSLNAVARIDGTTWTLVDTVYVGPSPRNISLSLDGTRLFVALYQASAVAILDLTTLENTEVVVGGSSGTGSTYTYDVIEAQPDRVFVSASPGSGGFSYIAQIDVASGYALSRVASGRIIRAGPTFGVSPDATSLYIGEGFSPNSLYMLDLEQADAPIVMEDVHGSVHGTSHLEVSPDGQRIYLRYGHVVRTADFTQAGVVGSGLSRFGTNPDEIFIAEDPDFVKIYSTLTFLESDAFLLPCSFVPDLDRFLVLHHGSGWLVLGDDEVCGLELALLFEDGFESGGVQNWTTVVP